MVRASFLSALQPSTALNHRPARPHSPVLQAGSAHAGFESSPLGVATSEYPLQISVSCYTAKENTLETDVPLMSRMGARANRAVDHVEFPQPLFKLLHDAIGFPDGGAGS